MADSNTEEHTFIMIKPDGVQRGLVGEIIKRFEQRGYRLSALKLTLDVWFFFRYYINCPKNNHRQTFLKLET